MDSWSPNLWIYREFPSINCLSLKTFFKGTLLHCWWECKLVQPLWRTVWRFLKKLEIELPMTQQSQYWVGLLHCQAVLYHECYLVSTGQSCCCLVVKLCPTLQPHGLQYARLPCPSLSPWVCSNLCSLSQWCLPSNHLMLCCPLLFLPSIFPNIRVFSNELALRIRWPKYWSFRFNISPSNEYSGLISFRIGWFDLLQVQGTLKSLLQHRSIPSV